MAAREWFTPQNTTGLAADDIAILNRAARNGWPQVCPPTRRELMELRAAYRPGMSADALLASLDEAAPIPAHQRGSIPEAGRRFGRSARDGGR